MTPTGGMSVICIPIVCEEEVDYSQRTFFFVYGDQPISLFPPPPSSPHQKPNTTQLIIIIIIIIHHCHLIMSSLTA